ncbi:MAG: hypothetical protein HYV63_17460 [Candidatus Schekmanbacteria bacterium]|nr:hypothetical protein [Candidatus Schekmanbacteria bacterium]
MRFAACDDCHVDVHGAAFGPHGRPAPCDRCHATEGFSPASFSIQDHARTRFPLDGAHSGAPCVRCHPKIAREAVSRVATALGLKVTPSAPPASDVVLLALGKCACRACHADLHHRPLAASWEGAKYTHRAGFPLRGAHTAAACSACHPQTYATTSAACESCHRSDYQGAATVDHVRLAFPLTCDKCHSQVDWRPAALDHDLTAFPLTGNHRGAACEDCHQGGYAGTPKDCYSCHAADFQSTTSPPHGSSGFATTCATCHTTGGWKPANFDHSHTRFPTNMTRAPPTVSTGR